MNSFTREQALAWVQTVEAYTSLQTMIETFNISSYVKIKPKVNRGISHKKSAIKCMASM